MFMIIKEHFIMNNSASKISSSITFLEAWHLVKYSEAVVTLYNWKQ